jgi:hypothetical protein
MALEVFVAEFFRVKDFERFQHYKDRSPPWIKLYKTVLDDYEYTCLQDASKLHLILIWILASQFENRLPYDSRWIGQRIHATEDVDLDALVDAGFIEKTGTSECQRSASSSLAKKDESARPREQRTDLSLSGRKPIPSDWKPNAETLAFAQIQSLPHSHITLQKFKDHYASEGKFTADPDAAYRKWLTSERRSGGTHAKRGKSRFESDSEALDEFERRAQSELRESSGG